MESPNASLLNNSEQDLISFRNFIDEYIKIKDKRINSKSKRLNDLKKIVTKYQYDFKVS